MTTHDRIEDLRRRRRIVLQGGGEARIAKQHQAGKNTARERLELLLDTGSFVELDAFVETRGTDFNIQDKKVAGDGVVTGYGTIDGRLVFVSSQDFTVIGGSLGEMHAGKITKVMDLAMKNGAPFISINDSGGARIEEGIDALAGFGEIFRRNTLASGVIPQISVVMGPCAGGAVYSPAITDFVFMVENTSHMFITGPSVIKAVTGEDVTFETLGGAAAHSAISGVAHFSSPDENTCFSQVRKLLSFLPDNNLSDPEILTCRDDVNRQDAKLNSIIPDDPNKPYDMLEIIQGVVDYGDFFQVHERFAGNIIVGFGRIGGRCVGIVANQPRVNAGVLDVDASDKAARFVRFCDSFNIPLLTFTDVPGYLPGIKQEHSGIIRHGAKLLYAFAEATVPKINVIVRKAYGGAYIAMNSRHLGADIVLAWPTAEIAVMGPEGAANIIFRKEIGMAEDPVSYRQEKIREYREKFSNPYIAAARGYVDDVIEPSETRQRVASALDMLAGKRETRPPRKHGNIPL
jgi:Carboxyl transferase domain.